ncbi:hypothetical protein B296_00030904, partial [Ensete ventricosum]
WRLVNGRPRRSYRAGPMLMERKEGPTVGWGPRLLQPWDPVNASSFASSARDDRRRDTFPCTLLIEITFPAVTSSSSSFLFVFAFAPEECPRGFFRSSPEAPDPITMASANAPIAMREALTLPSLGINPQFITFTHVTMESDKYICVRETAPQNSLVIIDMSMPMQPLRRPITADSALMNPDAKILALKGFFFFF